MGIFLVSCRKAVEIYPAKLMDFFRRKVGGKLSRKSGHDVNVSVHGDFNEHSGGQFADKSELEESIASVSGNRADAETSDEYQPKQAKKKKRSQLRSKSVGSRPSAASESSGPETTEQEFRERSKSAHASVSTSTAIKPFQKNVGFSEDDNTVRKLLSRQT